MNNRGTTCQEHQTTPRQTPYPLWLLAELTYACPLQCPYCSNPVNFAQTRKSELSTAQWLRVLEQGRSLGAVQLGLSGGEPCVRPDLEAIVAGARSLGYYINLLTSTVGLDQERVRRLRDLGVDHIQVSFQGVDALTNDFFAGTECFRHKLEMAQAIRALEIPMVLNFVLHRHNIHQVQAMLELAVEWGAEAVELANCQFQGWAYRNLNALLPSQNQILAAETTVARFRQSLARPMPILFVVPDLYESRPRPCVNGWGSTMLSVAPDGRASPCQGALDLPGVDVPNVRDLSLEEIWFHSPMFNRFRGSDWMQEPCRSCPEQERDFGGCRCQAYLLTGDPRATDPACAKSPHHAQVLRIRESAGTSDEVEMRSPHPRRRSLSDLIALVDRSQ